MPFHFKTIEEIGNVKSKKVLLLVDFNVPHEGQFIKDDFRIKKVLPTINFLRKNGAKIFLLSHIGSDKNESLEFVAKYCEKYFPVKFTKSIEKAKSIDLKEGEAVLIENVRILSKGEVANDSKFAESMASLGDIYVNEAFSLSHRSHASVTGIPKFLPSYSGFLFADEVKNLSKAFNPEHPFILVFGGKKAETKTPLIERFISSADKLFVGGALANDFFKAKGFSVGESTLSENGLIKEEWLNSPKLFLPEDVIVENKGKRKEILIESINESDKIVDAGASFIEELRNSFIDAKLVIWNGPLGLCEDGLCVGTDSVAEAITNSDAFTIVGGGDTVLEVDNLGLESKFSFVSTGGGAMLDFLATGSLPGIKALEYSASRS